MKITDLEISGLKLVEPDCYKDERGFFLERYNQTRWSELGFKETFVQDNFSRSFPRVLRGLHFQTEPNAQGKLVGVTRGRILDVAVDLRRNSPTFGKHYAIKLDCTSMRMLYIPEGFAHGFCVLGSEPADVLYKTTALYNKQSDGGIRWDDEELNIAWPVENPLVSEKDKGLQSFKEFRQ